MRWGAGAVAVAAAAAVAVAVAVAVAAAAAVPVSVLLVSLQGDEGLAGGWEGRVFEALAEALLARGYEAQLADSTLGAAIVACQSPECVEQSLDAVEVELAVVPALWLRADGSEEFTLTLLRRRGRNLNARGPVEGELSALAAVLVDELLARRAEAPALNAAPVADATPEPRHPHDRKAGPVLLIAGGSAAFIAIGVGAATKRDDQQLNGAAVAAWSVVGAAALAGGVSWWVVGAKRRRKQLRLDLSPTKIDLRLQF